MQHVRFSPDGLMLLIGTYEKNTHNRRASLYKTDTLEEWGNLPAINTGAYSFRATDGNIVFSGVSRALFPAVVMATMDGRPMLPAAAFNQVGALPATSAASHAMPGQTR